MHKFLIHNQGDDVGVATEDIREGDRVVGVHMDTSETVEVQALSDIPLGHKIALRDMAEGHEVTEYRIRVGVTREKIHAGGYVHTHNIRSARWSFDEDGAARAGA